MSKYELSAKNDDPTILNNLSFQLLILKMITEILYLII